MNIKLVTNIYNAWTNKTTAKVIKERTFGETYFRDIYSGFDSKLYRKPWKEFDELKNIGKKYYCSNYYDVIVNKYGVKGVTTLWLWENKNWINSVDTYGWFEHIKQLLK